MLGRASVTSLFYSLFGETDIPNAITAGNAAAQDFVVGTPPNQTVSGISVFEVRSNVAGLGSGSAALYFPDEKSINPASAIGQNYFLMKEA